MSGTTIEAPTRGLIAVEVPEYLPRPESPRNLVSSPAATVPERDEPGEGEGEELDAVELPPLLPGLPNTPYKHCEALICAIVWQAIVDRDLHWCASQSFNFFLSLLGWDNATILAAKRRVLHGPLSTTPYPMGNFLTQERPRP